MTEFRNSKQVQMLGETKKKSDCFDHWNFGFGYYLEFDAWDLGFYIFM